MAVNLKSLYSKDTAKRIDKVQRHGERQERIPGRKPSQKVLEDLGLRERRHWPRYEPAYRIIKTAFPEFEWKAVMEEGKHFVLFYDHPNPHASLAEIVLESYRRHFEREEGREMFKQRVEINTFPTNIQQRVKPLLFSEEGEAFAKLLVEEIGISYPPMSIMESIRDWFYRALEGEPTTVIVPVCPDYETENTGNPANPKVYTFKGLGDSIGYVAQRALYSIPKLWHFFHERGLEVNFVVAIGDFEAESEETRKRVGVTKEEFLRRLRRSQEAFQNACPIPDKNLRTPFISEIAPRPFEDILEDAKRNVEQGDYGALGITENDLEIIAKARKSLYKRWFGEEVDSKEVLKLQAPEYMAMGEVSGNFSNPLLLGVDSVSMAPFMQGMSKTIRPVLYLRNVIY